MKTRFPDDYFYLLYKYTKQKLACPSDLNNKWRVAVRKKLLELLHIPSTNPDAPEAEIVETKKTKNFVRYKVILKMPIPYCNTPVFLFKPGKPIQPATGILCLHGHGGYYAGKDMVADYEKATPIAKECAEALNYMYGRALAEKGYYTICPDAFHFGEKMPSWAKEPKNDICSQWYSALSAFGLNAMGLTVFENITAISYLLSLPEIKNKNVGCVGLSFGGIQTIFTAAVDHRIKAAVISGALCSLKNLLKNGIHICGAQIVPDMLKWFDFPDILASLAPRPVLYEIMKKDVCFNFKQSKEIYNWLKCVYRKQGFEKNVLLDIADTDHRYSGKLVEKFFSSHLFR